MVECICGKTIDKIPSWLSGIKADFVCTNCPKRQVKKISQIEIAPVAVEKADDEPVIDEKFDDDDD